MGAPALMRGILRSRVAICGIEYNGAKLTLGARPTADPTAGIDPLLPFKIAKAAAPATLTGRT
jgi:hypothetical protein